METDALDYALIAIFFIVNEEKKVYPVAFHFHTFTIAELDYNMYDKKLLAIFEAFKIWWHYLKYLAYPIDIVIDHKNLEYFSTTKILTWRQVRWSEYLSQFNLVIRFYPGYLGTKLDTLTRQWDIYPKGILAILQLTLTTSNLSSLKNNLQSLYELLLSFSLLSA